MYIHVARVYGLNLGFVFVNAKKKEVERGGGGGGESLSLKSTCEQEQIKMIHEGDIRSYESKRT